MTPLPLPTDNLYKFCAFFGMVLIILPTYLLWTTTFKVAKHETALIRDATKEQVELDALKRQVRANDDDSKIFADKDSATRSNDELKNHLAAGRELLAKIETNFAALKERDLRAQDLDARRNELRNEISQLVVYRVWGGIMFVIGGLLTLYGFRMWKALQKKQDELLDLQLKEARAARK